MVKRLTLMTACLVIVTALALAAEKQYYSFPEIEHVREGARMLIWDNMSGSRNITGKTIRDRLSGYDGQPGTDGYDGQPGAPALFCNLSGGTRSITYDENGLNPQPAMQPFSFVLRAGGQVVSALRQQWVATIGSFYEITTGATVTPSVPSAFTPGNHYVQVFIDYSASAAAGGKRSCVAAVPLAVTRVGATGPQGTPGANADVTEANVMAAFAAQASDTALRLKADTAGQVKLDVQDAAANTRFWVDSGGNWRGNEGLPTTDGDCLQATVLGVKSWGNCVPATITGDRTLTGTLSVGNQVASRSAVPSSMPTASVSGTYQINLATATAFDLTLTGNTTFTVTTPTTTRESLVLYLTQGSGGSKVPTMPTSFRFGTPGTPTWSTAAGKLDACDCRTRNQGSTWECACITGY